MVLKLEPDARVAADALLRGFAQALDGDTEAKGLRMHLCEPWREDLREVLLTDRGCAGEGDLPPRPDLESSSLAHWPLRDADGSLVASVSTSTDAPHRAGAPDQSLLGPLAALICSAWRRNAQAERVESAADTSDERELLASLLEGDPSPVAAAILVGRSDGSSGRLRIQRVITAAAPDLFSAAVLEDARRASDGDEEARWTLEPGPIDAQTAVALAVAESHALFAWGLSRARGLRSSMASGDGGDDTELAYVKALKPNGVRLSDLLERPGQPSTAAQLADAIDAVTTVNRWFERVEPTQPLVFALATRPEHWQPTSVSVEGNRVVVKEMEGKQADEGAPGIPPIQLLRPPNERTLILERRRGGWGTDSDRWSEQRYDLDELGEGLAAAGGAWAGSVGTWVLVPFTVHGDDPAPTWASVAQGVGERRILALALATGGSKRRVTALTEFADAVTRRLGAESDARAQRRSRRITRSLRHDLRDLPRADVLEAAIMNWSRPGLPTEMWKTLSKLESVTRQSQLLEPRSWEARAKVPTVSQLRATCDLVWEDAIAQASHRAELPRARRVELRSAALYRPPDGGEPSDEADGELKLLLLNLLANAIREGWEATRLGRAASVQIEVHAHDTSGEEMLVIRNEARPENWRPAADRINAGPGDEDDLARGLPAAIHTAEALGLMLRAETTNTPDGAGWVGARLCIIPGGKT